MAFSNWDIGACNCGGCNVKVTGCFGLALPGALVQVYDHAGGTLLDSGTTDSSGTVSLSPATTPGYSVVSCARFVTKSAAGNPCGATIPLSIDSADGYQCIANCAIPLPPSLSGSVTGIPGVGGITLDSATAGGIGWGWVSPPPDTWAITLGTDGGAGINCDGPCSGMPAGSCDYTTHSYTCPPSFHWTGSTACAWISSTLDVTE